MRKLASIQKIKDIRPIPNADAIDVATVNGWDVVVKKGIYEVGETVIYCEVDAFLPIEPEFEFLRKTSYKKLPNDYEGFRLKTIKMRGQVSQGLVIPLDDAQSIIDRTLNWAEDVTLSDYPIETDVSEELGIIKYEKPIPACLAGEVKGYFPSFISKTDQERIQNLTDDYDVLKEKLWFVTEKLDGSSATFYIRDGEFGVCSRNIDLLETEDNTFWRVARELEIEKRLRDYVNVVGTDFAIQGELIGEGIQGNMYNYNGQTVRFFDVFNINEYQYILSPVFDTIIQDDLGLETVPIIDRHFELPDTVNELLELAEGDSKLIDGMDREGLVFKNVFNANESFKVISNKFLLKED